MTSLKGTAPVIPYLERAISAFCRAISAAFCAPSTARSTFSLILLARRGIRFFLLPLTRMFCLYFPSSFVPSGNVVQPQPCRLLLSHSPSYCSPSDRRLTPNPVRLSFFHSPQQVSVAVASTSSSATVSSVSASPRLEKVKGYIKIVNTQSWKDQKMLLCK